MVATLYLFQGGHIFNALRKHTDGCRRRIGKKKGTKLKNQDFTSLVRQWEEVGEVATPGHDTLNAVQEQTISLILQQLAVSFQRLDVIKEYCNSLEERIIALESKKIDSL